MGVKQGGLGGRPILGLVLGRNGMDDVLVV